MDALQSLALLNGLFKVRGTGQSGIDATGHCGQVLAKVLDVLGSNCHHYQTE
jgi:hypothetical protein